MPIDLVQGYARFAFIVLYRPGEHSGVDEHGDRSVIRVPEGQKIHHAVCAGISAGRRLADERIFPVVQHRHSGAQSKAAPSVPIRRKPLRRERDVFGRKVLAQETGEGSVDRAAKAGVGNLKKLGIAVQVAWPRHSHNGPRRFRHRLIGGTLLFHSRF
ncbi:MAG: hypothetical protein WA156_13870 [Methylocystis silviterrae]